MNEKYKKSIIQMSDLLNAPTEQVLSIPDGSGDHQKFHINSAYSATSGRAHSRC